MPNEAKKVRSAADMRERQVKGLENRHSGSVCREIVHNAQSLKNLHSRVFFRKVGREFEQWKKPWNASTGLTSNWPSHVWASPQFKLNALVLRTSIKGSSRPSIPAQFKLNALVLRTSIPEASPQFKRNASVLRNSILGSSQLGPCKGS